MTEPSATQEDQQFLALLVHRGFFAKADAVRILQSVSDKGFTSTVLAATGWDVKKLNYLRQTKGLLEPVIPGFEDTERVGTGGTADVFRARSISEWNLDVFQARSSFSSETWMFFKLGLIFE